MTILSWDTHLVLCGVGLFYNTMLEPDRSTILFAATGDYSVPHTWPNGYMIPNLSWAIGEILYLKDLLVKSTIPLPSTHGKTGKKTNTCDKPDCIYCAGLNKTGKIHSTTLNSVFISKYNVTCQSQHCLLFNMQNMWTTICRHDKTKFPGTPLITFP